MQKSMKSLRLKHKYLAQYLNFRALAESTIKKRYEVFIHYTLTHLLAVCLMDNNTYLIR